MKLCFLFLSLIAFSAHAKIVNEQLTVSKIKWNQKKGLYRLSFTEKAGVYYADRKHLNCLRVSIQKSKPIKITFNTKSLHLTNCSAKHLK